MAFLLDTNIPSELTRSRPEPRVTAWLEAADDNQLYLSVITLGEIRKGFVVMTDDARRRKLEAWLDYELRNWFAGRILPIAEAIAERWGELDGRRQLQGRPLNTADGLIAATALEHDLTLLTHNTRDFEDLGVRIVDPWKLS